MRELYETYGPEIYRFLLSLSHDEYLAEELTQETLCRALLNLSRFRGDSDISVWLIQIAKNLYYEHYNRAKRQAPLTEWAAAAPPEDEPDVGDREAAQRIVKIVHTLPEPYKEVFMLRVFGEIELKQISALFGKSESWARVTYYRAKAMIVERLGDQG